MFSIDAAENAPLNAAEEAIEAVLGQRRFRYGHPLTNFETTAELMAPIVKRWDSLPPHIAVGLSLIALKVARVFNDPSYRDNYVDIIGYALCMSLANEEAERRE